MALPMGFSLSASDQIKMDTKSQVSNQGGSGGGVKSSITNNLALGGSSVDAQTGGESIPTWIYVSAAVLGASLLWLVYQRAK